ncbi:MAG: hypothetical protein HYV16_07780 [Gammaproteobacteria bacterium]|nr:hypothetical protein [Gammaproteobacteria bacterium]
MRRALNLLLALLTLAYPAAVYFGLEHLRPRELGLMVCLLLAARLALGLKGRGRELRGLVGPATVLFTGLGSLSLGVWLTDNELLLRLYPALVNAGSLLVFALSLWRPPSLIERLARLTEPNLPPEGVAYTRRVTLAWCFFLAGNGLIAAWTALFASREAWALYNGAIAYGLMGLMLGGEWLIRRRVRDRMALKAV